MRLYLYALSFLFLISTAACKSNNNNKAASSSPSAASAQSGKFQPHDGFSPVPYGVSLDPNKDDKIRKLLGTDTYRKVNQVDMTKELNDSWIQLAKNLIASRRQEDGNRFNAALTSQYWVIDGIFKDTMANPQIYEGQWVKFENNDTYTYGTYDKVRGNGIYHYKLETDNLIMVDNDPLAKPLEFDVQYQAGFIVFFGTKTYDDIDIQMKLLGRPSKPQKG